MARVRILSISSAILALLLLVFHPGTQTTIPAGKGLLINKEWLKNYPPTFTPAEMVRPPDQTFLTYPEWFLVFGPAEQADFFQNHTATKFPFMVHVHQIWEGYWGVYQQIRGNFPFNTGYHVMIVVISTSSTVEFGLKAAYETVIGRLTDTPDGELTQEDQFNAKFARDYATFLNTAPWYEFDFKSRLIQLWTQTSLFGPHPIRKWERKYILTTELAVKTVYGWLIGIGTHSAYDRPQLTTAVVVDAVPEGIQNKLPDLKVLKALDDQRSLLISLPRYTPFTSNACELAAEGVNFKEIAGNKSAVLLTVLAPTGWKPDSNDARVLFTQVLPSRPGVNRVALATPVAFLRETLLELSHDNIQVEHIFDF